MHSAVTPFMTAAPSYRFLYCNDVRSPNLSDNGKAFLSPETGFLPPSPLPHLPEPYNVWETIAKSLPSYCKSGDWNTLINQFPAHLSVDGLPDEHLLRANICVGAIAHSIRNSANLSLPDSVLHTWKEISTRLGRSIPCLSAIDITIYNIEECSNQSVILPHNEHAVNNRMPYDFYHHITTGVRPFVTLTGSIAEGKLFTTGYEVEKAAGKLPGILAHAQQAVVTDDPAKLRHYLIELVYALEQMTIAFRNSSDPRPLSDGFMDHVEWARAIEISALSVLPGERTGSGLLFPSFHVLDIFFSRSNYDSVMGKLSMKDRPWLPKLHQDFFEALSQVSVFEFVTNNNLRNNKELTCIFRRALAALASDQGFLGKHHLRTASYLEMMFKVSRPYSSNGSGESFPWQTRAWASIVDRMRKGMTERIGCFEDWYHNALVTGICPEGLLKDTFRIVLQTNGALVYQPGDHIAIISENSSDLVSQALQALELEPETMLTVKSEEWKRAFANRQQQFYQTDVTAPIRVRADLLLRCASLGLDEKLASRLTENMFVVNPIVHAFLKTQRGANIPMLMKMLREFGAVSPLHLKTHLDQILCPLAPRFYSAASHMRSSPSTVELLVTRVNYQTHIKLPCEVGAQKSLELERGNMLDHDGISVQAAKAHLRKYITMSPRKKEEPYAANTSIALSKKPSGAAIDIGRRFCEALRSNRTPGRSDHSWKATFKAQAILYNLRQSVDLVSRVEGVSSSFISRLLPGSAVSVRVVPELGFRLPGDSSVPVIMIALGNGIAPFISFLKDIRYQKKERSGGREAWLILGVKSRHSIPFVNELEEAVCKWKSTDLSIAFSQDDCDLDVCKQKKQFFFRSGSRKRILSLFEEKPELYEQLWHLISRKAHIYACGRPELQLVVRNILENTVRRVQSKSLKSSLVIQKEHPEDFINRLIANRKLHFDCYYSGKPQDPGTKFSVSEVAGHRAANSCWVILQNHVYDVTGFLQAHPGGPKILLDKAGRDLTEDFNVVHGLDNLRIISLLTPYKIGNLNMFSHSCGPLRTMMRRWSVPLVHGLLERRSVFLMDWNEFPELQEPEPFRIWKSQHSSDVGIINMCRRFWTVHEPDLFGFVEAALGNTRFGPVLETVPVRSIERIGTDVLLDEIRHIRENAFTASRTKVVERLLDEPNSYMRKCAGFVDEYVKMGIRVQQLVEWATDLGSQNVDMADLGTALLSKVFKSFLQGTKDIYNDIPGSIAENVSVLPGKVKL